MGLVQLRNNEATAEEFAEVNNRMEDERKNKLTGDGHSLLEYDEVQIYDSVGEVDIVGVRDIHVEAQTHSDAPKPQKLHKGAETQWNGFEPLKSLKVLLIENDESTRHLVSALLGKCGYEVIEVSNGLQAWKYLEDQTNQIDIVLTEVALPSLSGIDLLSKIMSHKTRQNVPVVMMSIHDSDSIVFNCLSNGATDFLVKPIRKNELKTLWRHVWRKCHSKSRKTNRVGESENSGSNNNGDGSIDLNEKYASDDVSGTQVKRIVDSDGSQPISLPELSVDPSNSSCTMAINSKPDAFNNKWLPATATREGSKPDGVSNHFVIHKGLELRVPGNPTVQLKHPGEDVLVNVSVHGELKSQAVHMRTTFTDFNFNRLDEMGDKWTSDANWKVLRHSEDSAFSRYKSSLTANQTGNVSGCSALDNCREIANTDSVRDMQRNSNGKYLEQRHDGSSNNHDMGSSTSTVLTEQSTLNNIFLPNSVTCLYPSPANWPVQNYTFPVHRLQPVVHGKLDASTASKNVAQAKDMHHEIQVHHHHHYHHQHVHDKALQQLTNYDDNFLKIMVTSAPPRGSYNVPSVPSAGNAVIYNSYKSTSGSNNVSNGQYGSSNDIYANDNHKTMDFDNKREGNFKSYGRSAHNFSSRREAALRRFHYKRRQRCFDKKVRYQERKRLAEQRPRARGQFVRRTDGSKQKDTQG